MSRRSNSASGADRFVNGDHQATPAGHDTVVATGLVTSRRAHADIGGGIGEPVPIRPGRTPGGARHQHQEIGTPGPPPLPYRPGEVIWSIPTGRKIVVLTFDDGPDRVHDLALATSCGRGYEGKATFFFIGQNVNSFPRVARALFDRGYTIGNHTMTHAHYDAASEAPRSGRARTPSNESSASTRGPSGPPAARRARRSTPACAAHGLAYIWTDGDENDWKSPRLSPGEINARFAHYLHPGYISLRHSGGSHDNTVAAMHSMLDIIESSGYEVMSLIDALAIRDDRVTRALGGAESCDGGVRQRRRTVSGGRP